MKDDADNQEPVEIGSQDSTFVYDDAAAGHPPSQAQPPFPVENWDRYRCVGYLGGGGMGLVFKGFDPRLGRHVALKFIRAENPEWVQRFQREARAQARVDHEHICNIYDVGEVEGHSYIAMQFIDGVTLEQAARNMKLEQKLLAMKQVAEALHEAHRKGLIHRDVKPRNIMVEQTHDGRFKPYVMDFGLVLDADADDMTRTGEMLGTLMFMPPEQAAGSHGIDRRSDVYALGATMYAILAGRPPFNSISLPKLLQQILEELPESLHGEHSSTPVDVDSITMKCLRKWPEERYHSARELAEDIGRYLDGEPVEARRTTVFHRLRMKAARHRLAVSLGSAALVALAVTATWGAYSSWTAARRARLAQDFGQRSERIEALARYTYLLPLHDVRGQRAEIQQQMHRIEQRMAELGHIAKGPGHYALGRSYMTMSRHHEAREQLEIAWDTGYREPEVALARGQVLGALFREGLRETETIAGAEARQARRDELRREYLEPAIELLSLGEHAENVSPSYVAALLAFYERQYDDALRLAGAARDEVPWLYEAEQLAGDIGHATALEHAVRGEYDAAHESYAAAEAAYRSALELGRSDPSVLAGLCTVLYSRMRTAMDGSGESVRDHFERGAEACESALEADAEHVEAHCMLSALHQNMAQFARNQGQDPQEHLEQAIASARAGGTAAMPHLGNALLERARHEQETGTDPSGTLEEAAKAFAAAVESTPDFVAYNRLGVVNRTQADHEARNGRDPRPKLDEAIAAYRQSIALNPDRIGPHNNIGIAFLAKADHERISGEDPEASLDEAIAAYRTALGINPNHTIMRYNLARVYSDKGYQARSRGRDPSELFHLAADTFAEVIESNPESVYLSHFYNGRGSVLNSMAIYEIETGADPRSTLESSREAFDSALAANPNNVLAHFNLGVTYASFALYEFERGDDPRDSVAHAVTASLAVLAIDPDDVDAYSNEGQAHWIQSRYELEQELDPRKSLAAASSAFDKVLQENPNDVFATYSMAGLRTTEGRWRMSRGADPSAAFEAAVRLVEGALELDPDDPDVNVAAASTHRWRALWRLTHGSSAATEIDKGLETVSRTLSINPRHAEGMALQGHLLLLSCEDDVAANERSSRVARARESLERALTINGNLTRRYEPVLLRARELSKSG